MVLFKVGEKKQLKDKGNTVGVALIADFSVLTGVCMEFFFSQKNHLSIKSAELQKSADRLIPIRLKKKGGWGASVEAWKTCMPLGSMAYLPRHRGLGFRVYHGMSSKVPPLECGSFEDFYAFEAWGSKPRSLEAS